MTAYQINNLVKELNNVNNIQDTLKLASDKCKPADGWNTVQAAYSTANVTIYQRKRTTIIIDNNDGTVYKTTNSESYHDTILKIEKVQKETKDQTVNNGPLQDHEQIAGSKITAGEIRKNLRNNQSGDSLEKQLESITNAMQAYEEVSLEKQKNIAAAKASGAPISYEYIEEATGLLQTWDIMKEYRDELKQELSEQKKKEVKKKTTPVRFLMFKVTNGVDTCKVWYSYNNYEFEGERVEYIGINAANYGYELNKIFPDAVNNTDSMIDYFDKSSVRITKDSPHWAAAMAIVEKHNEKRRKRREKYA